MECWEKSIHHFQPILPVFQPSDIPEFKQYHHSLFKSIPCSSYSGIQTPDFGQQTSDAFKVRIISTFHFGNSSKESSL